MASRLHSLAIQLKLPKRMQEYCEVLAADPRRNQRKAAVAVGYSPKTAHVIACKLMKDDRVIKYLMAIDQMAMELEDDKKIAKVRESLEILTAQARKEQPWEIKETETAKGSFREVQYKPGLAASRLLDHYEKPVEQAPGAVINGNILIQMLQQAGPAGREAVRGLLRSGSATPMEADVVDAVEVDEPPDTTG